jgi:hypothetical protein
MDLGTLCTQPHLNITTTMELAAILTILQMVKLKHRKVKKLACGHTVNKWQSHDLNPGILALGNLPSHQRCCFTQFCLRKAGGFHCS